MQVCTLLRTDNQYASTPPLCFLQAGCPSCRPTNSVKALKAQEEDMLLTNKSQKLVYLVIVINTLGGWETTYNAT